MFNSQIRDFERLADEMQTRHEQMPHYIDFINCVKTHDYSYMMSDSQKVWHKGVAEEKNIEMLIDMLINVEGLKPQYLMSKVKENVTDYLDKDSNGNGLAYRVINSWFKKYLN